MENFHLPWKNFDLLKTFEKLSIKFKLIQGFIEVLYTIFLLGYVQRLDK